MTWMESYVARRRARDAARRHEHLMAPKVSLHRTHRSESSMRKMGRRLLHATLTSLLLGGIAAGAHLIQASQPEAGAPDATAASGLTRDRG